jgi:hypothetical protein
MTKFAPLVGKLLSYDDIEWAGIKECFSVFFEKVKEKLYEDPLLSKDVEEHIIEINDYVML